MIILSFLTVSCSISTEALPEQDYGIPSYDVIMDEEDYSVFDANEYSNLTVNAALNIDGKEYAVQMRHQGNTTRGLFKKNYYIEFDETDPTFQCKSVILSGQQSDPSMLRSILSYYMFSEAGFETPAICPVALKINGVSSGLYYLIEPINEDFFLKRGYTSGELYKAINSLGDFSLTSNEDIRDAYEKRSPEDDNYYTLEQMILLLDKASEENYKEEIEKHFDVDKYLKYMAVSALICNFDGIVHNYYLNRKQSSAQFNILPWDMDLTFYYESYLCAFPATEGLIGRLLQQSEYRDKYIGYMKEYIDGLYSEENINNKIEELKGTIAEAYNNDRWLKNSGYNIDDEAGKLKTFVDSKRIEIKAALISM